MDGGDAGSHRALAGHDFAFPEIRVVMSDLDTLDIGNGIIRTGAPSKGTLRIPGAGFCLSEKGCSGPTNGKN